MFSELTSLTALWWAVIFSGVYHGINPGMGWPLAVSAALMYREKMAFLKALSMLAIGHFVAMIAILLPFSLTSFLVEWEEEIRIGAGFLVASMGTYLLVNRKHPKFLVRVHPARLVLWSFLAAMAHGAGLMLLPIYLGICSIAQDETGHLAIQALMESNLANSFLVAGVHTASMTFGGGLIATIVHLWVGLKFLSKTWFNLDFIWALSLIFVGFFGISSALSGH